MGGGETSTEIIRYAPYLEDHHVVLLDTYQDHVEWLLWNEDEIATRPYSNYTDMDIEDAFFGAGYSLTSFPSLYDMYGKFMAGLDVEVLFNQHFADTISGTVVSNLISEEALSLEDDIVENANPRFVTGMRDMNSVMSSTFVVGKALMEVERTRAISKFSAEVRYRLLPIVAERWKTHLAWNRQVIEMYAQILKFYVVAEIDVQNHNFEVHTKDKLWPFSILEYNRLAIGTLHGAQNVKTEVAGAGTAQKAIGGAMMGAASGAMVGAEIGMIGGPLGALIGGIIGLGAGFL